MCNSMSTRLSKVTRPEAIIKKRDNLITLGRPGDYANTDHDAGRCVSTICQAGVSDEPALWCGGLIGNITRGTGGDYAKRAIIFLNSVIRSPWFTATGKSLSSSPWRNKVEMSSGRGTVSGCT